MSGSITFSTRPAGLALEVEGQDSVQEEER